MNFAKFLRTPPVAAILGSLDQSIGRSLTLSNLNFLCATHKTGILQKKYFKLTVESFLDEKRINNGRKSIY